MGKAVDPEKHFRQRKWSTAESPPREKEAVPESADRTAGQAPLEVLEKVCLALVNMGFANSLARRAIAEVSRANDTPEALTLERALREALQIATRMAMAA